LARELHLRCRTRSFGPKEPYEVGVSTKGKVTQAQIQAGDDPPQEIYLVLGFELMGVPLTEE
jgi:hypothetical protein